MKKVVIHCSGGKGRTGHILVAWLVFAFHQPVKKAIQEITESGRNPLEAINAGNANMADIKKLLTF